MRFSLARRTAVVLVIGVLGLAGSVSDVLQPTGQGLVPSGRVARAATRQAGPAELQPVGAEWLNNGGNLGNERYSTLDQINADNVKDLKAAWVTHLGSGLGAKYSLEVTPIVQNGVMYVTSGNDDAFAYDAKTGDIIWQYNSGLDQSVSDICCGWDNRGVALGDGMLFLGQLDGNFVALDQKTGKVVWKTLIEDWHDGYGITSAPLYYNGVVYTGISGAEFGVRGRLTALAAKTGQELWRFYTVPEQGQIGGDTWPADNNAFQRGGASVWQTPAIDPDLGLIYFATGNASPDYDGSLRPGDNLFTSSIVALNLDGTYAWHFQEVHHDIWDYDAPGAVVLFDTTLNGQPRKALAQAGKTGWVYILDRTDGTPLIGIDEQAVKQEQHQLTSATQPIPQGDAFVPQCSKPIPGIPVSGCIFQPFWDAARLITPGVLGGDNWAPISYNPMTGYLYVVGTYYPLLLTRVPFDYAPGKRFDGGRPGTVPGTVRSGTLTAIDATTNKIAWQKEMKYPLGEGSGTMTTAGGLVFHGEPDGNFQAYDAKTGDLLWNWQTGSGADAPPVTYEIDGVQYVTIAAGGNQLAGSPNGDTLWTFSLKGDDRIHQFDAPKPPTTVIDFSGTPTQTNSVALNEYSFTPSRVTVAAGTEVTFTNAGAITHTATQADGIWDTGDIRPGASSTITFTVPGTYTYICTPHPWMIGEVQVTDADGNAPSTPTPFGNR